METDNKFLGLKFLNKIDLMPPMKHTRTEMIFLRKHFTEIPYYRITSMYYKSSLENAKKKKHSSVIVPQEVYSRTETDADTR